MIKANELRIGNCVILLQDDVEIKEQNYKIDATDIAVAVANPKRFSPILLTPVILEKCGFTDGYNCYSIEIKDETFLKIFFDPISYSICCHTDEINFYNEIFVHQLQNLFFALTGKELEIKL